MHFYVELANLHERVKEFDWSPFFGVRCNDDGWLLEDGQQNLDKLVGLIMDDLQELDKIVGQKAKEIKREAKRNELLEQCVELLREHHNLILTGAPGTGKTYLAKEVAKEIDATGDRWMVIPFNDIAFNRGNFRKVLHPVAVEDGVMYVEQNGGAFKKFCEEASSHPKCEYVCVIDGINSSEIGRLLGEQLIPADPSNCRSADAASAEMNEGKIADISIPDNVYVIGTMSNIDGGVESLSFSLRSRFTWKEIAVSDTAELILGSMEVDEKKKIKALNSLNNLNKAIACTPRLGKQFQIGAGYLKRYEGSGRTFPKKLWESCISGILREYLRGCENAEEHMKSLKRAFDDTGDYETDL